MPAQPPPSPPFFVGAGPAGTAYPEIRRKANLSASPYPFRFPPSFSLCPPNLPLPAIFVGGAKRRRVSKDSPPGESPRLAVPVPPLAIPSPYTRHSFRSPPLSLAARSVAAYPKDSPSGESPRFGWGGLSRRGPAPSLTPRLPSHAPPFPQPSFTLGGGCREGGPSRLPIVPGGFAGGRGAISALYRNPQSRLVRTHRPSRSANPCAAEIASFEAPDVCEAKPSARPGPTGPGPKEGRRLSSSPFFRNAGPSRKRTLVRFRDQRVSASSDTSPCCPESSCASGCAWA